MLRILMRPAVSAIAGALLALPAVALPSDATADIPVTDPALLARLGYDADAGNVYATPEAYRQLLMDPTERDASQEALLAQRRTASRALPSAGTLGDDGSRPGYSPVWASAFSRLRANTEFRLALPGYGVSCYSGFPTLVAQLHDVPHGAQLDWVDMWYRDESVGDDLLIWLTRVCQPDLGTDGLPDTTVLGSFESFGALGDDFASFPIDDDVDLESCAYYVSVAFDDDIPLTVCTEGLELSLHKVRVQWRREVSPPPATATFDDVPTGHLFFRHIEALAAAGITGGCDADSYCPNAPLTRGQMAVFLARALGLHWGDIEQP